MLPVCECSHILLYLVVGYLSVNLCSFNVGMPQHLRYTFHRNTLAERHGCKRMSGKMVNTSLSKRKRNIGGNMVTGCELVVFLCSATDRDRQNSMEY